MTKLRQDLVVALRRARKSPGFTGIAIVSLALGIGANTAIFSVINGLLLRGSQLRAPEELVEVYLSLEGFEHGPVSYPDLLDLQRETGDVFAGVAGSGYGILQVDGKEGVSVMPAELVTGNYFDLLGVEVAHGRPLTARDEEERNAVVVLDHIYWERELGGDPGVIGQTLRIGGSPYTIVGIVSERHTGNLTGLRPSLYAPIVLDGALNEFGGPSRDGRLEQRGSHWIFPKARLAPGRSAEDAERLLGAMSSTLLEREPSWQGDMRLFAIPTRDVLINPAFDRFVVPAAGLLLAVVGLILLIACANLASFLLAKATDRRKEVAMRLALGAPRRRLIAQLLTETLLLAAVGGVCGVALAVALLGWLLRADLPLPLPLTFDFSLDVRVLSFSLLASLGAGLLFGLAPALQSTRPKLAPALKGDDVAAPGKRITLRKLLVASQVAVSTLLLVVAGLFVRSMWAAQGTDPGFGAQPTAILNYVTSSARYTPDEARRFQEELRDRVAALPGVQRVGAIDNMPLNLLNQQGISVNADGVQPPPGRDSWSFDFARADPGFFQVAGIPMVEGREFTDLDDAASTPVAIVNQALVDVLFPGRSAIGEQLRGTRANGSGAYEIVGVARTTKVRTLGEPPRPMVYVPFAQDFSGGMNLLATTEGSSRELSMAMLRTARELDPDLRVFESKTMERHLGTLLFPRQASAWFMGVFAGLAMLLASIGLYGVVSYSVAQRSREVAIRTSLGADPGGLVRLLMRGGMRLVAVGAAVGLVLSLVAQRALQGLLTGVGGFDPLAFLLVPAVFLLVAMTATLVPAVRACRASPVTALRAE